MANQAGIRPERVEWIQETTEGETPANPEWNLFSDDMKSGPRNTPLKGPMGRADAYLR